MRIILFINIVRFLVLFVSTLALTCHVIQCLLLSVYQDKTNIPSWSSAGHWQYLSWYIALSISTISGAAVCVHACCCKRGHILRGDRFLGLLNVLPLLTSLVTDVFVGGPEPWTAGTVKFDRPHTSFFQSCSVLDAQSVDQQYPILYQRCVLSDGTWLGAAIACVLWILLACLTMWARSVAKSNSVAVAPAKEPKWGRYIPEPPPSLRSSTLPIVPLPPRHGSVVSHQNPYYDPRSDVSLDSQTSSTSYGGNGGTGKRFSMNYYDAPPDLPYHYYNNTSSSHSNNYPQLSMLPMVPRMDRIDLFDTSSPPSNTTTTHPTTTATYTDNHRYSDLFSYSATSPQPPAASQLSPMMHHQQSPLLSPLSPPPPFAAPSYQDKHTSWEYDHYPQSGHLMSPLSPSPLSPSPLSPIAPVAPPLSPHHHNYSSSPGANMMLMPQRHASHRYSTASDTMSSVGYSSSSNTAYHTQIPSATVISGGGGVGRDLYPVDHHYNSSNSNSSSKRYSSPMIPEFSMSPPAFSTSAIGSGGPVMDERRRPSVITVDSISVQKPQQYDLHRSS